MGLRATSPVLIGRQNEFDRLVEALDVVTVSGSAVMLVAGEAGGGKTRLVQELAKISARRGFRVCVGRCLDLGEAVWPLAPLREIVAALAGELDDETLDLVMGGGRSVLTRLGPDLAGERADDSPVAVDRLCELVVGMFARLAQRQPLLLVIEDLHWADGTTRMLFSALARLRLVRPLLLVGTFRSDELHRRHPLRPVLAEIERGVRCERVDVRPLDRAATAELIAAIGGQADRSYVDDVHRRSAGNPFFVEELVMSRSSGVPDVSDTLRDVIVARAGTLDATAMSVLGAAAAAGPTMPAVLADVCGFDTEALRTTLDSLFRSALLVPDGDDVRFRHELGREVFYEDLLPGERARLHAHLAASLEARRPERLGEIARHWSAAHDAPRALATSVAAGREMLRTGAASEAEGHLARALEVWDIVDDAATISGLDHPALLVEAAVAAEHARHLDRAIELALRARAELDGVDPLREGEVWLLLRDLYRFGGRRDDCNAAVERALGLIPASPPSRGRSKALADASSGQWYANHPAEALSLARDAVASAEALADREMLVYARNTLSGALELNGDLEAALATAIATVDMCGPDVSPDVTLVAYNGLCVSLYGLGRFNEIPAVAERAVELARRTGLAGPRGGWLAGHWVAALVAVGRWDDAERIRAKHGDLFDDDADFVACYWIRPLLRQGRLDEARPAVERIRTNLAAGYWAEDMANLGVVVVELDAAVADGERIIAFVDDLLERSMRGRGFGVALLVTTGVAALADQAARQARGQRHSAVRWVTIATEWIDRLEQARLAGSWRPGWTQLHLDQARAELTRLQGAPDEEHWARLAEGWEALGAAFEEAYARWRRAEALLSGTAGRTVAARKTAATELATAAVVAERVPVPPLLTEIHLLARRARLQTGIDEPTVTPADFGLTPRELEVLALLAAGRTNGQIGKALYIGTKTASTHVSAVLRKLGVTNRVEAAAVAHRHSLDATDTPPR